MCFALDKDFTQKAGQIAHLDQERTNDSTANLAWLCLLHHDEYDSRTSQSKGYTKTEVERYRDLLHGEVERWRQSLPHDESADLFRYKQQLLERNTGVFFFAAYASRDPVARKRLLEEVTDPDFKAQLIEAWNFLDTHEEPVEATPSRQELMARYIGSTDEGREDLTILLGLAGEAISKMSERDRNYALFELQSDTIRSGLMLLHKIRTDRSSGDKNGA
jgi:hypothetical protein